ncbi:MAG: Ig-like domain-containing protein [Nitrospirota bacterium]
MIWRTFIFALIALVPSVTGCTSGGETPLSRTLVSIALSPANPSVAVGTSQQFTATGTYSDSSTRDLTSSATWKSSNASVTTIDSAGLATPIGSGTATITAKSGGVSGSATLAVIVAGAAASQPQINITMDLHCDPLSQLLPADGARRDLFRTQVANATWLLDFVEPYGIKVSFLAVGECYEYCTDASEAATCLPLLARLQASGGMLGTHQHVQYSRGPHDWPDIPNAYANPAAADVRLVWESGKQFTDNAIGLALGLTDAAAIAAVNTAAESHAQLADHNQLMKEYGYTIREGGGDQALTAYFSHVPWNPFRPGATAITEDLTTTFMTVPQGAVIGQVGEHAGIWQDGSAAGKKAELLQLYANWKERNRTAAAQKVWSFGWGVHTQDLNVGSDSRAAIMELIPWLSEEFVTTANAAIGNAPARFASYIDVRNEYQAWEAAHPGVSSFDYPAETTDYGVYPYLESANRYLRFARFDSRVSFPDADVFLLKAGIYSAASPTTYLFALASATSSTATVDLSPTFGAETLRSTRLSDGAVADVPASAVPLTVGSIALCAPAACDAILALDSAASGVVCGTAVCGTGKVCATDVEPDVCVPDCRLPQNVCPTQRPTCDVTSGVCHL